MSAPVNTGKVINHVLKREPKIGNDQLIKLAGGSDSAWLECLRGPQVQVIVRACNAVMSEDNYALASEGIGSKQWQLVTIAEKNRREAEYNLMRVDQHLRNAFDSIEAIVEDRRAPRRLRKDAQAWIELFSEPGAEQSVSILKEFAVELAGDMATKRRVLKLVKQ